MTDARQFGKTALQQPHGGIKIERERILSQLRD